MHVISKLNAVMYLKYTNMQKSGECLRVINKI